MAHDIIATMGQAFELRFKSFLKKSGGGSSAPPPARSTDMAKRNTTDRLPPLPKSGYDGYARARACVCVCVHAYVCAAHGEMGADVLRLCMLTTHTKILLKKII